MKLKQVPEDFVVKEIPGFQKGKGQYNIFLLKKRDYTTEKAIQTLCSALHIDRKRVGYAGIKDRRAVTEQYISILHVGREKVESLEFEDLELEFIDISDNPISLGDLKGNKFEIVARDLDEDVDINSDKKIKNYFDEQRFSHNNDLVGKAMIKGNFEKAVALVLESQGSYEDKMKKFLEEHPNNYIGALQLIPHKILLLFVHAYQSRIFNKTIEKLKPKENVEVPIVGFDTDFEDEEVERIIQKLMKEEKITERDFIIQSFPSLTCMGDKRKIYVEPQNLEVSQLEEDELNKGKYKVKITFSLPKGAYATNVAKQIIKE